MVRELKLPALMWWSGVRTQIQNQLGEGSQGRVFKALRIDRQSNLTQTVAVKILHSKTAVELWKKEFESLQRVRSPYCVQVFAFERLKGHPALVLEWVDGVSLMDLGRTTFLSESEVVEILAQVQCGLLDLHAQGTFHGDLSPHNVLIDRQGRIRLLDFGLANGKGRAERLTPEFAAPERLAGGSATLNADLFSLGRLEQFLRGQELCGSDSPYLALDPCERQPQTGGPEERRQAQLALTIGQLLERRARAAEIQTQAQQSHAYPAHRVRQTTPLLPLLIALFCLCTSSASQAKRADYAQISMRTQNWYYFMLDGAPLGYAPVTAVVKAGRAHRLEWISARGRGERKIQLEANAAVMLSDSDFSH